MVRSLLAVLLVSALVVGSSSICAQDTPAETGGSEGSVPSSAGPVGSAALSMPSGGDLDAGLPGRPGLSMARLSLLDPAKFRMSQGVSFTYAGGTGRKGTFESRYLNRLFYTVTPALSLRLDLDYVAHPFGSARERDILPGAALRYQPNDNILFHVQYGVHGGGYSGYWWRRDRDSIWSSRW